MHGRGEGVVPLHMIRGSCWREGTWGGSSPLKQGVDVLCLVEGPGVGPLKIRQKVRCVVGGRSKEAPPDQRQLLR